MAAIDFTMNNLSIHIQGVNGWMDTGVYTNTDPVDYIFKAVDRTTGDILIYRCVGNTPTETKIPGWRRLKTDQTEMTFLGGVPTENV